MGPPLLVDLVERDSFSQINLCVMNLNTYMQIMVEKGSKQQNYKIYI